MRTRIEDQYVTTNKTKQQEFIPLHDPLQVDLAFFNKKLRELQDILSTMAAEKQRAALEEIQTVHTLIEKFQAYLHTLAASRILGCITIKKIDDTDFTIFQYQVKSLHQLRQLVEVSTPVANNNAAPEVVNTAVDPSAASADNNNTQTSAAPNPTSSPDKLSKLIDDAKNMQYNVSYQKVWLRRVTSVLTSLVAFAAATVLVCVLMTPGVNVIAALTLIPTVLFAMGAFWYLRSPVSITQNITPSVSGATLPPVQVQVPAMSTIGAPLAGFMGVSAARKLPILNPPREVEARQTQAATIHCLTDELKKKIAAIQNNDAVQKFLSTVVDKADRLYDEGVGAWFYETRTAKTKKAHLILRETAKIVEQGNFASLTVASILATKINQTGYTFGDLLNSQRNHRSASFFRKTTSATVNALQQPVDAKFVSFADIAQALEA